MGWGTEGEVDHVEFIPDDNTRLLAVQSGEIDMAFNVPPAQATQWESIEQMDVKCASDLSYVGMYFDTALAPFDDVKVREAFAHSIDRTAVVDTLLHGRGEVATAIATPESLREVYTPKEAGSSWARSPVRLRSESCEEGTGRLGTSRWLRDRDPLPVNGPAARYRRTVAGREPRKNRRQAQRP